MKSLAHLAKTASILCSVSGLGLYPLELGSTEINYIRTCHVKRVKGKAELLAT